MLYGASWIVLLIDILAVATATQQGSTVTGYLPTLLGALVVILMVHYTAGWFPFRHPG